MASATREIPRRGMAVALRALAAVAVLVFLALLLVVYVRARCFANDAIACRFLGSYVFYWFQMPLPPFDGVFAQKLASRGAEQARMATIVLVSEEGAYFSQRPWPAEAHTGRPRRPLRDCESTAGQEHVQVLQFGGASPSQRESAAAHVRVFHSPDWQSARAIAALRATAMSRDIFVHYSRESPLMFPADLDAEYMGQFELRNYYHRAYATFWWPYIAGSADSWGKRLRRPQTFSRWKGRLASRLLVTAVSNCFDYTGRREFLTGLRAELGDQFINVGSCVPSGGPNRPELGRAGKNATTLQRSERALIGKSFFYLALENANCEDYITEKLGRAALYGAVPVVFDAPQSLAGGPPPSEGAPPIPGYHKVLPPGSYINVASFESVAALAAHLRHVAANETAYTAYQWPRYATADQLKARWPEYAKLDNGAVAVGREGGDCEIARAALRVLREAAAKGQRPPRLVPDTTCLPPRQLCHFLPKGTCMPGSLADRIRPIAVARPTNSARLGPGLQG